MINIFRFLKVGGSAREILLECVTHVTSPAIRGHLVDCWSEAERVKTLVTDVAYEHAVVITRVPTLLAYLALRALPASPHYCVTFYFKFQAITMVMLPA